MNKVLYVSVLYFVISILCGVLLPNTCSGQSLGVRPIVIDEFGLHANTHYNSLSIINEDTNNEDDKGSSNLGAYSVGIFYQPEVLRTGYDGVFNTHTVAFEFNFMSYGNVAMGYKSMRSFYFHMGVLYHFYRVSMISVNLGIQAMIASDESGVDFGLRTGIEIEFAPFAVPLTIYIAPNPIFVFIVDGEGGFVFDLSISVGFRYYFNG